MLSGYDSIKNTNSVTVSATVEFEWNMNDFGSPIISGTSNPIITGATSPFLTNTVDVFLKRPVNLSGPIKGFLETRNTTYTTTSASGKSSIYNDGSYYRMYSSSTNSPVSSSFIFRVGDLLSTSQRLQQLSYGYVVSLWIKTPYSQASLSDVCESLDVDIICTALNRLSSGSVITDAVTKRTKSIANSADWKQVLIEFDAKTTSIVEFINIELRTGSQINVRSELLVDQIQVFPISSYQAGRKNKYTNINQVFKPYRPGEYLVKYKENSITNLTDYPSHFYPYGMGIEISSSSNLYGYISTDDDQYFNPSDLKTFVPYITKVSTDNFDANNTAWCLYDNNINVNKIVIKQNLASAYVNKATSQLYVWVLKKTSGVYSWTQVGTAVSPNANGISILYYNSGNDTWGLNKWSSTPNISTGSISNYTQICGIAVESDIVVPNDKTTLMFVEISPRLTLDVSNFVESYSINKEMSDDSDPLPIGQATSDVLTLNLNNFPIISGVNDAPLYSTQNDIIPFNNNSKNSPLYGTLRKGIGCFLKLTVNSVTIPQFSGYVNSIRSSEDSAEFEVYDIIKRIQDINIPASKQFFSKMTVKNALSQTLRAAGVHDFDPTLPGLNNLSPTQSYLNYYWIESNENTLSAIDELAKIYQFALYSDEYGKIQIKVPPTENNVPNVNFYLNDISTGTELANIISLQENNIGIPKSLSISYDSPNMTKGSGQTVNNIKGATMMGYVSAPIWTPTEQIVLSSAKLSASLGVGQDTITIDNQYSGLLNSEIGYSGYYLIDREIVSFDSILYDFYYTLDINPVGSSTFIPYSENPVRIYSQDYLEKIISDIKTASPQIKGIAHKKTDVLGGVRRALFGTKESDHLLKSSTWNDSIAKHSNYGFVPDTTVTNFDANFGSSTGNDFGIIGSGKGDIAIKDGYFTIPNNTATSFNYNYHIPLPNDPAGTITHNYFKALIQLGVAGDTSSFTPTARGNYCGIFIQADSTKKNGLWIGVGSKKTGNNSLSIILKAFGDSGKGQIYRHLEFTENDPIDTDLSESNGFGNTLIDLNKPILFEVYFATKTVKGYPVKIYINGFLLTNKNAEKLFQTVCDSGISITTSDYLYLPCNFNKTTNNFGVFHWGPSSGNVGAIVEELVFSNKSEIIGYDYNQNSGLIVGNEKEIANNILYNIDNEKNLLDTYAYNYSNNGNNFFRWTGSNYLQGIKIFDLNIEQKPILNNGLSIFAGKYLFTTTAYLDNYKR